MVRANFTDGNNYTEAPGLTQWDYGQVLEIHGLDLPKAVEIHFAIYDCPDDAIIRIGNTIDKVTCVVVPEKIMEQPQDAVAYVYVSDTKSGETVRTVYMPMIPRQKPEAFDAPEDAELFKETIETVNAAADRAELAKSDAETARDVAQSTADETETARAEVEALKSQAQTAAESALLSEQNAKASDTAAQTAQAGAETAEGQAELFAGQAEESKNFVEAAKAVVMELGQKVADDKSNVEQAVSDFEIARQNAFQGIKDAENAALKNIGTGIDDTLTQSGKAAGAKATGDKLDSLKGDYNTLFDFNNSFNRWNPNDLISGTLKFDDGTIIEGTNSNTCNYLKRTDNYICSTVTQDDGITVSGHYQRIAQYDVNKNFIKCSYGGSEPILLDDNCEYVRVSITKSQRNVCVYFNSDGTLVAYTPYHEDSKKIKGVYLPSFSVVTSFTGKKMCSFGDSITAHGTWQDTVKNALGLSDWQNCGVSGSMISGSGDNQFHSDKRINAIDNDCDFIVIMGGVNDAAGRTVGEQTLENHSIYQVFGSLNVIISKIMYKAKINDGLFSDIDYSGITRFTNRKEFPIYLCTQPIYVNQTLINDGLFEEIQNAIRKCGELWGIPVIDVNRLSRLNKANMGNTYYSSDGLHPNANGGKLLGMCIANGLKNNEPYFD